MARLPLAAAAAALGLAACAGPTATVEPSSPDRFGYRAGSDDRRETMEPRPATDSLRYLVFPAVVDSVGVRTAGRPLPGDGVAVEAVIQGALPDACAELEAVTQSRQGHFVDVELTMRQRRETVCAAVVRPFRTYLVLDGPFEAGSYTLTVNGSNTPFQVLPVRRPEAR